MDIITAIAIIGPIFVVLFLLIAYWKILRLKPRLSVEVVACRHSLRDDDHVFLLWLEHRVHNRGKKNTRITGMEAHFVDAQNKFQSQTLKLSIDVGGEASTPPSKTLFSFIPPFPYAQSFEAHFILYHTYGREVFATNSVQSNWQTQA
jgi:hypothetical protein